MTFQIEQNVSLAEYTTLKIGGKARFFFSVKHEEDLIEAVSFAEENDLKIFVLGGGSNVLIADTGFDGVVLKISLKGISIFQEKDKIVYVTAKAGEDWDKFVAFGVEKNLQGIECLSGIPGLVGGTPVQNVGAYGQEVSETIVSVRVFDGKTKTIKDLSNSQCEFSYRTSLFNTTEKNRYVVLSVTYALSSDGEPKIVYRDLQNYFGDAKPTLEETRRAVLKIRAGKSMVIDPRDPNSLSVGSFFKNPIITTESFAILEEKAAKLGIASIPSFKAEAGNVKVPAAWLIERSGFNKGFKFGCVGLSTKHTLAIINRGGATAGDVLSLKNKIQVKVKELFGIELNPEPVLVGFL